MLKNIYGIVVWYSLVLKVALVIIGSHMVAFVICHIPYVYTLVPRRRFNPMSEALVRSLSLVPLGVQTQKTDLN